MFNRVAAQQWGGLTDNLIELITVSQLANLSFFIEQNCYKPMTDQAMLTRACLQEYLYHRLHIHTPLAPHMTKSCCELREGIHGDIWSGITIK